MAMLAGLAGGYVLKQRFENWQEALPQIGRGKGDGLTFKLSIRIISASVPALSAPGVWSRQRPRLEATLGDAKKTTEFADYIVDDNTIGLDKAYQCPWRFGETLTFVGRVADVLSPGLRVRLFAHSDFALGPVQFQFSGTDDLGEASIDIRKRGLPACIGHQKPGKDVWESPVLVIPLSHVRGGKCAAGQSLGDAVGHVTMVFSVDTDPEMVLAAADGETRGVADRAADVLGVTDLMNWMDKPLDAGWLPQTLGQTPVAEVGGSVDPFSTFLAPADLAPDGWVSHTAPSGRKMWHHRALGPAPWEEGSSMSTPPLSATPKAMPGNIGEQLAGLQSAREGRPSDAKRIGGPRIASPLKPKNVFDGPDQDPAGWVSHKGPDGRLFWHHLALGPPPWELKEQHHKPKPQSMPARNSSERPTWAI